LPTTTAAAAAHLPWLAAVAAADSVVSTLAAVVQSTLGNCPA
jgi:hypothetical protein